MFLTNSQMHIFHTVVAQGGFSQAARVLGVDPSTVSKSVTRLEQEVSLRLIDRSTRAFAVTQEGQILFQACADALQTLRGALDDLSAMRKDIGGKLRVFASSAVAEHRVAPLLSGFHHAYPEISVDIIIQNGYTDPIEAGVDLTLSHETPTREGLVMRRISDTAMCLVATPDFLNQFGRPESLDDLAHMPCICSTLDVFNNWVFESGSETRVMTVRGQFRASSGSMMRRLALQGLGVALLSADGVKAQLRLGRLEEVTPKDTRPKSLPLYAVYHDRRLLSSRIRAFTDYLSQML